MFRAIVSELSARLGAMLPQRLRAIFGVPDASSPFYGLGQCVAALAASSAIAAHEGDEEAAQLRDTIAHHIEMFLPCYYDSNDADPLVLQSIQEQVQHLIVAGSTVQPEETWNIAQRLLATIEASKVAIDAAEREQYRGGFTDTIRLFALADMVSQLT